MCTVSGESCYCQTKGLSFWPTRITRNRRPQVPVMSNFFAAAPQTPAAPLQKSVLSGNLGFFLAVFFATLFGRSKCNQYCSWFMKSETICGLRIASIWLDIVSPWRRGVCPQTPTMLILTLAPSIWCDFFETTCEKEEEMFIAVLNAKKNFFLKKTLAISMRIWGFHLAGVPTYFDAG